MTTKIKKYIVIVGAVVLLGIAWSIYCSAGVVDKTSPEKAAIKIAAASGCYNATEVSVSDAPSIFTEEKSFPISVLAKQQMITLDVHRTDKTGKIYIHLYKWAGFGWKLLEYYDATIEATMGLSFGVYSTGNKHVLSDPANDFKVTIVNKSGEELGIVLKGRGSVAKCGSYQDPKAHKLTIDTAKKSVELDGKPIPYSNRGEWIYEPGEIKKQ